MDGSTTNPSCFSHNSRESTMRFCHISGGSGVNPIGQDSEVDMAGIWLGIHVQIKSTQHILPNYGHFTYTQQLWSCNSACSLLILWVGEAPVARGNCGSSQEGCHIAGHWWNHCSNPWSPKLGKLTHATQISYSTYQSGSALRKFNTLHKFDALRSS